mgnify:CR=1 FL=1
MSRLSRGNHFLGGFGTQNYLEDYHMGKSGDYRPVSNISENDAEYKLELGIPGFRKEDIELSIHDNRLIISGQNQNKTSLEYQRQEFNHSTFKQTYDLPGDVDKEHINATCKNGMLEIFLPKKRNVQKPHSKITIK